MAARNGETWFRRLYVKSSKCRDCNGIHGLSGVAEEGGGGGGDDGDDDAGMGLVGVGLADAGVLGVDTLSGPFADDVGTV